MLEQALTTVKPNTALKARLDFIRQNSWEKRLATLISCLEQLTWLERCLVAK